MAKNFSYHVNELGHYMSDPIPLGPRISWEMRDDPRRMVFVLSRYKFVAKMLQTKSPVLEVGCGEAFGTPIVVQATGHVVGIDLDAGAITDGWASRQGMTGLEMRHQDILAGPPEGTFQGAYSLDVIEHIPEAQEKVFMDNIVSTLPSDGVCLIGTPNKTAAAYASEAASSQHINLKDHRTLRALMDEYFQNVFLFSMNDEVVHTGFEPMAHYLFAMGVGRR